MNNRMLSTTPGAQTLLRPPPRDQPRRVTQRDRAELQVNSSGHSCSDLEPDSSSGCRSHGHARELGVLGVTTGCLGSGVTDSTTPRPRAACHWCTCTPSWVCCKLPTRKSLVRPGMWAVAGSGGRRASSTEGRRRARGLSGEVEGGTAGWWWNPEAVPAALGLPERLRAQ